MEDSPISSRLTVMRIIPQLGRWRQRGRVADPSSRNGMVNGGDPNQAEIEEKLKKIAEID